ncbi:MAG: hypothetical protein HKL96_10520 [Phycisphaerales bacterium]|nr:hypothetical protein [Phycisphaerales bacterium]
MQKELRRIAPLRAGVVVGILQGILGIIFAVPMFLIASLATVAAPNNAGAGGQAAVPVIFTGVFILFVPLLYAIIGFLTGLIGAAIYNLVARWTGGFVVEVRDLPGESPAPVQEFLPQ